MDLTNNYIKVHEWKINKVRGQTKFFQANLLAKPGNKFTYKISMNKICKRFDINK